jgi:hypothetical protein
MASREQRYRHEIPGLFTMPARVTPLSEIRIPWNIMRQNGLSLIELLFTRHRPSAGSREHPSWLNMLLTEPPVTNLWIEVCLFKDWTSIAGHSQPGAYISRPVDVPVRAGLIDRGGVTFGMVRDAVDKIIDQPAYDRLTREGKPVTTRICFIADGGVVLSLGRSHNNNKLWPRAIALTLPQQQRHTAVRLPRHSSTAQIPHPIVTTSSRAITWQRLVATSQTHRPWTTSAPLRSVPSPHATAEHNTDKPSRSARPNAKTMKLPPLAVSRAG